MGTEKRTYSGKGGVVKTFRMPPELVEDLSIVMQDKRKKMRDVITEALAHYLSEHLGKSKDNIDKTKKLEKDLDISEYMLIPINYYALFNDMAVIDVKAQIKRNALKSVEFGSTTLILMNMSENSYKKAELLALKWNVSNIMKDYTILKNRVSKLERTSKQQEED